MRFIRASSFWWRRASFSRRSFTDLSINSTSRKTRKARGSAAPEKREGMAEAQKRICIFTGSSPGERPEYAAAARELARVLVERGYGLVYGGGNIGLMSVIADAVLERGGEVVGVIPEFLVGKELAHRGLTELRVVKSM